MLKAAVIVGSGGFIYGYDIGIISGTLLQLERRFSLSSVQQGLVVSLLPLGSIAGCVFGGPLCDYIGRWQTIILQNLIYIGEFFAVLFLFVVPSLHLCSSSSH